MAHNGAIGCQAGAASVSGIHEAAFVDAAIAAGVLVVDYRPASFTDVCKVAISGPMLAHHAEEAAAPPYGALDYCPLDHWLELRRAIGCTIHNG